MQPGRSMAGRHTRQDGGCNRSAIRFRARACAIDPRCGCSPAPPWRQHRSPCVLLYAVSSMHAPPLLRLLVTLEISPRSISSQFRWQPARQVADVQTSCTPPLPRGVLLASSTPTLSLTDEVGAARSPLTSRDVPAWLLVTAQGRRHGHWICP